jgi:hypothetical protein
MGDEHHELDLPAAPATRRITPAPEDFANPPSFLAYLWPVGWIAICVLVYTTLTGMGWHEWLGHGH